MPACGIMFHHFHGGNHPAVQGSISAEDLADMIRFLGRDRLLSAREWLLRATAGALSEDDLCLTFDDTLRCQFDVALPVLRDFGLTAFWFVQSSVLQGNVERLEVYRAFRTRRFDRVDEFYETFYRALDHSPLASEVRAALERFDASSYLRQYPFYSPADRQFRFVRDEVLGPLRYNETMDRLIEASGLTPRELAEDLWMKPAHLCALHAAGHVIGLHSHTHPTRLAELPPNEQRREYQSNYACLRQLLPEPPVTMSHPCNSYNEATLALLRRLGIQIGFRANLARTEHGPLEYPRADHANVLRDMQACASRSSPATSLATPH